MYLSYIHVTLITYIIYIFLYMSYNDIASLVSVQKLPRIRPRQIFLYLELTTVKQIEKKEEGKASEVEKIS